MRRRIHQYSQNFNRYSYVLNNPLNKTDPSGYSWLSKAFDKIGNWFSENWRTVVAIVVVVVLSFVLTPAGGFGMNLLGKVGITSGWAQGAIVGSMAGASNAAINGGNSSDILRAGIVGGIQGGIAGSVLHGWESEGWSWETARHVTGHGVVGGAANVAMGGKFQDGFLSAAASAAAGDFGLLGDPEAPGAGAFASRTIRAGIVGGTASVIGGGKFANGAWTAAFQHLLNREIRRINPKNANGRFLTNGEKRLLRENFGDAIDLDKPKVYNFSYVPGARTMAPDGNIYAPGNSYSQDYSLEPIYAGDGSASQALFIHESTHVWQFQSNVPIKTLRITQPGKHADYNYHPFDPAKKFSEYGIEQQAMLVEDFFKVRNGTTRVWNGKAWKTAPSIEEFRKVVKF